MVYVSIETEAGKAVALGRLFERFGCEIVDCRTDRLRVGLPGASNEAEAAAEARLYLSMRPPGSGASRVAA